MSKEHQSHHHHHHSHGRRNWVLPLLCVAMVVGGGYWMNVTSSDPGPQQQAGPVQAGPVGQGQVVPAGSAEMQAQPGMQNITPSSGQSAATSLPEGMEPVLPSVRTIGGISPGPADSTTR